MAWHRLRARLPLPDEATRFRMEQGQEVGALARTLYPDGLLVAPPAEMDATVATQVLIADGAHQTLFEAMFESGPFVAKADILSREAGGWHLLEVKSSFSDSTSIREYVDDLAYTAMVLESTGLAVSKTSLVLLSREFRHGMSADRLFAIVEKTDEAMPRAATFRESADAVAQALLGEAHPEPVLVSACRKCEFFATACLGTGHAHTVIELPNLHHTKLRTLSAQGIIGLRDVPDSVGLTERQQRVKDAAVFGQVVVEPGLGPALETIQWPCHYLDFETVATVMPLYEGHGCHQQILT